MVGIETFFALEKFYQLARLTYEASLYAWSFIHTPKKDVKFYELPPTPNEFSKEYEYETARFLLALSLNASSALYLGDRYPTIDGKEGIIFGKPRPCGMLFETDRATFLIFSNTKFFEEWVKDAQVAQVEAHEIRNLRVVDKIHKGFYDLYRWCKHAFTEASVAAALAGTDPEKPLIVAGHSLGGALTTLASIDLCKTRKTIVAYSFGAPRSLSVSAADTFGILKIQLQRIFNTEDIVPTLPLANMPKDAHYQHVGVNTCFTDNLGDVSSDHVDAYVNYYNITTLPPQ